MKISRRQTVLLFELISSKKPLSYAFLQNYFGVCRRTIHEDVKRVNDVLAEKHSIQIHYQNGRGFSLEYASEESLDALKNELTAKFSDSWEIENNMAEYYCQILAYFFTRQSYGKLDELSSLLNLNSRSTTNLLSEIRKKLERYQLSITVRPHYGLKLSGQEKHIRYCVMDIIYRYNMEWESSGYHLDPQEKESLASLCAEYIKEAKMELSSTAVNKLVYLMMISRYRANHDHPLLLSKEEKDVYSTLCDVVKCDLLTDKLEKYYQCRLPEDEKVFYGIYLLTHIESFHQNTVMKSMSDPLLADVLNYLEEFGICAPGGSRNSWEYFLKHLVRQSVLMDAFDVFERSPNSTMKKAVKNTPLAVTIGDLIFSYLEKRLHRSLGEAFFVNVVLAAYSCIRNTQNTRRMNSIAILTPLDKRYGESLKRRVTDRYSNIIRNIEVISNAECTPKRLMGFDTLLYCGSLSPAIMNLPIHKIEVDYFFTKEDSELFYENIVVPSRIYRKAFGQLHKEDCLYDVLFTSMEDLIKTHIQPFCSEEVLEQMKDYEINEYVVNNRTMNILLFVKEQKDAFSKVIHLRHIASVNDTQFTRIYIHAVKLDGDLIKLKTTEKVVRNLTNFRDTEYDILNYPEIDFYDYYIFNKKTRLK